MSLPQDASDRDFFRSHPNRDHRVRPANAGEIAWAHITPADVPPRCIAFAAVCRNQAENWAVSVFIGPAKLRAKPGREERTAQLCFVNAVVHAGYFTPEVVS